LAHQRKGRNKTINSAKPIGVRCAPRYGADWFLNCHDFKLSQGSSVSRIRLNQFAKLEDMTAKYTLILLRHGNSLWNQANLFTGWVDVDLSDQGREEAKRAGQLLAESGLKPDLLFTSRLKRAINTANIALDAADRGWIDVVRDWRLNERHYGALQGKDKAQTLAEYGPEKFQTWRRSFDVPPPPIDDNNEFSQAHDERYADLGANIPKTECLKDVLERMLPFWLSDIQPALKDDKTVLITAHGNSLRALIKHLDDVSDEEIAELNVPTGIPLVYKLDENFKPLVRGGEYLDPEAAAAGAAAVAAQGEKK
jgi:2,3-bisphosphoglycerate-dependent phosphoglycerate mutase